jgi:hypothetical protein
MPQANAFDAHTALIEEVLEKIFYVLGDLGLMGNPPGPLPQSELALLEAIANCTALSASSRREVSDAIAVLPAMDEATKAGTPPVRRQIDAGSAIIYASQSRADLDHGLALITELFPTQEAADGVRAVKDMIKSGEGRIYPTRKQPLLDPGYGKNLPQAVFSAKSVLEVDAAAAFGAVSTGKLDRG